MNKTYTIPDRLTQRVRRIGSVALVSGLLLATTSAQPVSLYSFSNTSGGVLDAMSGASTLLGTGQDDSPSAVTGIGFSFNYEGSNYTQFSINSNGGMKLGGTPIGGGAINFNLTSNPLVLLPYSGDGTTANGSVSTVLSGSSPNQIRIVQWNVGMDYNVSSANILYQVWLYEGTGVIEFRYGPGAPSGTFSGGMQVAITGATGTDYLNVLSGLTASPSNPALFSSAAANTWPGNGTVLAFSPPPPCSAPTPGNTIASVTSGCAGVTSALSLQNTTPGSGVSYQWQSSPNGVDTWTNVGPSAATYTTAALSTTTWFRCEVTCSTGPSTVASTPVQIVVSDPAPTYYLYAGTQFNENFATWGNRCSTADVPSSASNHWKNSPTFGAGTWRATNTTLVASGWNNISGGPTSTTVASNPNAVAVAYPAARFHSRQGSSVVGTLDFHVNMSAATGSEFLRFEYINSAGSGNLGVWVSTNGGANFTQIGSTLTTTAINTWETKQFTIGSTSATTVIRLRGTAAAAASGNDIAVDNFRIIPAATCAAPTSPAALVTGPGAVDVSWTCTSCTGTYLVEYGAPGFTLGTGTVAGPFSNSPASITGVANGSYQAYVRQNCGVAGISSNAGPVSFSIVAGDFCSSAIDLDALPNADWSIVASSLNANNDITSSACHPTLSGKDVVLYHDVEAGATISLGLWSPTNRITVAHGGACPGSTSLACTQGGYFDAGPNVQMVNDFATLIWTNNGCNTVRLFALADAVSTGGEVYVFNYAYTPAGGSFCPVVNGITASTVNSGSGAQVSWDATCSGNVIVEYGPSGFTPGNGATAGSGIATAVNGTSTTLSGLDLGAAYDLYVRNDCGGGQYSSNGSPVQFTIFNGDDCTRVIDLSMENSPLFSSTTEANNDISAHDCGTFTGGDIILSYPLVDGATITFFAAHDYAATVTVSYGPSCPGGTLLTCENDLSEFTWTNNTGSAQTIYWIQDGNSEGDFSLEWIHEAPCTNNLTIEFRSDAPNETTWEILDANTNNVVRSGGPLNGSPETNNTCLPDGCYVLRVLDSGGDGMMGGGYILRTQGTNQRIIDNSGNFSAGSVSQLAAGSNFCVPIGNDRPIFASCDKQDWVNNQFIVATENLTVSAEYTLTPATSGYEFWFFDPNGSYSFRRFRSHATSDGFGSGATRACHFKINTWINSMATPHIPANTLMNVRIRGRVANSNLPFGPACLFKIDATRAACPIVKLQDNPLNVTDYSCGVNKTFGGGASSSNRITANPPQFQPPPLAGGTALRYQFRFRIPGEIPQPGSCIVRPAQTSATLNMNWTTGDKLKCNTTYEVDVRVSKDGGATWCVDVPNPACSGVGYTPWGKICTVNIGASTFCPGPLQGGSSSMSVENTGSLTMYPNPNRGDLLFVNLTSVDSKVNTVTVDIFDMTGKRVMARTIAAQDGMVNTNVDLAGELAGGLYMVNISAGDKTYTERLVIQP